jgi:hypothetical protein
MQITRTSDQSTSILGPRALWGCDLEVAFVIVNPRQVEQALVYQIRRHDVLVLDDDGIMVFRQREGVYSAGVLRSGRELRRNELAFEDRIQVSFNQLLERLLRSELRLCNRPQI